MKRLQMGCHCSVCVEGLYRRSIDRRRIRRQRQDRTNRVPYTLASKADELLGERTFPQATDFIKVLNCNYELGYRNVQRTEQYCTIPIKPAVTRHDNTVYGSYCITS
jgi:hypothetical protein